MKNFFLGLLLVAVAHPAFAQTAASPASQSKRAQAYYHFSTARLLEEDGDWNRAIEEFKKALDLDPNNSLIYSAMAETYRRHNRRNDAIAMANRAIEADPDNIDAHRLLRDIYMIAITSTNGRQPNPQDIQRAVHEHEEIVRIDPTDRAAFLMLGRLYQAQNLPQKAEEVYKKYLGIEPDSEEGVLSLARLHIESANNQAAAQLLENFLKNRPDSDPAWAFLGEAYSNLSDFKKAADAYKHAVSLNPAEAQWTHAYAQALYLDDQLEEAAKVYQQLLQDDPKSGLTLLRLGQIYRREMKYDQARTHLENANRLYPDDLEVEFHFFLLDRDEGLLESALNRLNKLFKQTTRPNGRYSEADLVNRRMFLTHMALLNSLLGRHEQAIQAFRDLKAISPEKDRVDAYIVDAYRQQRNLDSALQHLQAAMKEFPRSRQLQMLHADLIAERGRVDEGIRALEKLNASGEPDLEVVSTMIGIYERAKKYEKAQTILDAAFGKFPGDQQLYFLQGALYEKQKKYDNAEAAFRKALEIEKDDPAVLNYLGYMNTERGVKLEEALEMIQKAVKSDPINGAYLDSLGWAYYKLNRFDLAEQFLKKAVRFAPTNATLYDHLGELYYRLGRYQQAADEWTKALRFSTEEEETDRVRKKLDQVKTRVANR